MTAQGSFPKVDGDIYYASEVNGTSLVYQTYSGTNWDLTAAGSAAFAFNIIGSPITAKYAEIGITWKASSTFNTTTFTNVGFILQAKASGAAYANILPYTTVFTAGSANAGNKSAQAAGTFNYCWEIPATHKASGVQFQIYSQSTGNVLDSFNNVMSTLKLMNGV